MIFRNVGLFKYYEEGTSLKAHSILLVHLIRQWNYVRKQDFRVSPELWYRPTEEHIHFITDLSRRGEDFSQFLDVPHVVVTEIQLTYTQRYVRPHAVCPSYFQVGGGQVQILSFATEEARCLSLLVNTIVHSCGDGKCISFYLFYYFDSLI